jgi:hypothetical protein
MRDWNVCFEDGKTLVHVVNLPEYAQLLIEHGFTALNQQDGAGKHSLFAIDEFLDPQLFQLFLDKGADINLKNYEGRSVLREVLSHLAHQREEKNRKALDCLDILLSNGVDVSSTDNCTCPCSSSGCLPVSVLKLEAQSCLGTRINNPFWIFEWLCTLEDYGKFTEAKTNALSILRQDKFDETSLVHTCCYYDREGSTHLNEDRFWDISSAIEIDRLNGDMQAWEARNYDEIIMELMMHLKKQSIKKKRNISGEATTKAGPFQNENLIGPMKLVSIHAPSRHSWL